MPFIRRSVQSSSVGVTEAPVPRRPRLCPLLRPPRFLPDPCPSRLVATTPPAAGWWWLQTTRVVGGRSAELPRDAAPPRSPRPPHLAATRGSGSCPPPPPAGFFFFLWARWLFCLSWPLPFGRASRSCGGWRPYIDMCACAATGAPTGGLASGWGLPWAGVAGEGGGTKGGGGGEGMAAPLLSSLPLVARRKIRTAQRGGWSARRRRLLRSAWSCGRLERPSTSPPALRPGAAAAATTQGTGAPSWRGGGWAPGVSVLRKAPRPLPLTLSQLPRSPPTTVPARRRRWRWCGRRPCLGPPRPGIPPPREADEGRGGREGDEPRLGTRGTSPARP